MWPTFVLQHLNKIEVPSEFPYEMISAEVTFVH